MRTSPLFAVLVCFAAGLAQAQAEIPFRDVSYPLDSRSGGEPIAGASASRAAVSPDGRTVLFRERIHVDGAPWLQLQFAEANLGNTGSVRITSLEDGDTQVMGAVAMQDWGNASASFNGDTVDIELIGSPNEPGVFFSLQGVRAGDPSVNPVVSNAICGATDERQPSTDKRVGRVFPIGCTAWLISNGAILSAGHCSANPARITSLEFNTPPSRADGRIVRSAVRDQYPVLMSSIASENGGIGLDWGVFMAGPNSNTGMTPIQAQGASFRVSTRTDPGTVRVTGYGTSTGERNQAQQTSTGNYIGQRTGAVGRAFHTYVVDTTGGDSGSPIIAADDTSAIGIHTNGGCSATGGNNFGTSFNNPALLDAIRTVGGPLEIEGD